MAWRPKQTSQTTFTNNLHKQTPQTNLTNKADMAAAKRLCLEHGELNELFKRIDSLSLKNDKEGYIVTHDGEFHCDDVLACVLLLLLPEFKDLEIVRSRNTEIIEKGKVVVDVGGVCDLESKRFDHHQTDFKETFNKESDVKLSSSGLVFKTYGKTILETLFKDAFSGQSSSVLDIVHTKIYDSFFKEIDGLDNGITLNGSYSISSCLYSRIRRLNGCGSSEDDFKEAMKTVATELFERLVHFTGKWIEEYLKLRKAVSESTNRILVLEKYVEVEDYIFEIEKDLGTPGNILFYVYKEPEEEGNWVIRAIKLSSTNKTLRRPLEFRGSDPDDLNRLYKVNGCVLVNQAGFLGKNETLDGVVQMGIKSFSLQTI